MKFNKWLIIGSMAVLGLAAFAFQPAKNNAPSWVMATDQRRVAPEINLVDYKTGAPLRLSTYRGKVILVNFWATWCPPCRQEIPDFIRVREALRPKGFEILGVSLDEGGVKDVAPFAQQAGINYPVAIGSQDVAQAYGGIRGIPTSFLIDREGRIARTFPGMIDRETLEQAVTALL